MQGWIEALRVFGGALEDIDRERITAKLLARMAAAPRPSNDIINAIFKLPCDPATTSKVVFHIIDHCEAELSHTSWVYNSELRNSPRNLPSSDYSRAVKRIVRLIIREPRAASNLFKLIQELPRQSDDVALPRVMAVLVTETDNLRELESVTKARLHSFFQGRPLRTSDIATSDLLAVLRDAASGRTSAARAAQVRWSFRKMIEIESSPPSFQRYAVRRLSNNGLAMQNF
jgi:hypothetical protein